MYSLPRSQVIRRILSRYAAYQNRAVINGGQPISGLLTLTGKAERLPRGHAFRSKVASVLWNRRIRFKEMHNAVQ